MASETKRSLAVARTKEKPILFSGEMVRAILEGRKTQTRRVIKNLKNWDIQNDDNFGTTYGKSAFFNSKFGKVGERLYVRETHKVESLCSGCYEYACDCSEFRVTYKADGHTKEFGEWDSECDYPKTELWRPSLFMPRFLSRIILEITDIRVERLQDISNSDILDEGITASSPYESEFHDDQPSLKRQWEHLWQSINGVESWNSNPWVWVIEFKKVSK